MTLAKTTILSLTTALALGICLAPALMAQSNQSAKTGKTHAKAAKTAKAVKAAPAPAESTAASAPVDRASGSRRDPFSPLINENKEMAGNQHLPPGKAGLVITTVRVDGTVSSEVGMIAVLSNADQRTYFVREGDRLYDGEVEKIGLDGVTFRQNSKDAFGKAVERVVTKRIYASAGEQQ
jgi:Tfp pilus assembly protein PilP